MCSSHTAKELNLKFNQLYRRAISTTPMQRPVIFLILHFPFFTASVKQKQMNIPHHLLSTS